MTPSVLLVYDHYNSNITNYYLGCYSSSSNPNVILSTIESCRSFCQGFSFAGVGNGNECICPDFPLTLTLMSSESDCNIPCESNEKQICGGTSAISLYQVQTVIYESMVVTTDLKNNLTFEYLPPAPQLFFISPKNTYSYTEITLTGENFGSSGSQIVVGVLSGNDTYVCNNLNLLNAQNLICEIPEMMPLGNFSVSVRINGLDSSNFLTATKWETPVLQSISPTSGPAIGGSNITLIVNNLVEPVRVQFVSIFSTRIATDCSFVSTNTLNCKTPSVPISDVYMVSLVVGVGDGSPQNPQSYVYDPAFVSSINPPNGTNQGGGIISIIGVNFGTDCCAVATVTFGKSECTGATRLNDSLITCTAPKV